MWNGWWMEIQILCRHFEWQKWPRSMELKYSRAVCELLSHQHGKWFYIYTSCTKSQQDLTLTEAKKLTCIPCWRIELANCFAVLKAPYTAVFLVTQNGAIVSWFLPTFRFTFGYMWYCIRSMEKVVRLFVTQWSQLIGQSTINYVCMLIKKLWFVMWVGGGKEKLSVNKLLSLP